MRSSPSNKLRQSSNSSVERVILPTEMVGLPQSPLYLQGILKLEGRILPVVSLRKRFGLPPSENTAHERIIIVGFEQGRVGFLVDRVDLLAKVPFSRIESAPSQIRGIDAGYLEGVADLAGRLVLLIDLARILSREERTQIAAPPTVDP